MYGQQVAHATTYSPEIPGPILALANLLDCENPAKHRDSHWFVVRWRAMDFGREFVPRPRYFLLLRQKKVSKEKATRTSRPPPFAPDSLRFLPREKASSKRQGAKNLAFR